MTISEVRDHGRQEGHTQVSHDQEYTIDLRIFPHPEPETYHHTGGHKPETRRNLRERHPRITQRY